MTAHHAGEQNENTAKEESQLNGVAKTLFVTLVARAYDFRAPRPILCDPYAQEVLERLDLDAAEFAMSADHIASVAIRTSQFDRWTSDFLQKHPGTTVLHLACGLDHRMNRVKWGENTRWIDVDLTEVIALRRNVHPSVLPNGDYSLLGVDVLDESWMDEISTDGPVLIVMEGLLSYLREDDVNRLLQRLCRHFPGGEMMFECMNGAALRSLKQKKPLQAINNIGAEFHWSVDDLGTLELLHPDLRLVEFVRVVEAPGVERMSLGYRALMYLLSWIPGARDSARLVRLHFGRF